MGRFFGAGPERPYAERKAISSSGESPCGTCCSSVAREGSLDSAIHRDSEQANDFLKFFRKHRQIHTVFFNGQKAEIAYRRHVLGELAALGRPIRYERSPLDKSCSCRPLTRRKTGRLASGRQGCFERSALST